MDFFSHRKTVLFLSPVGPRVLIYRDLHRNAFIGACTRLLDVNGLNADLRDSLGR